MFHLCLLALSPPSRQTHPFVMIGLDIQQELLYLFCRYIYGGGSVKTRVRKWGNSLALRIPRSFAAEVGLGANSSVEMSLRNGKLTVVPSNKTKFILRELLARVTEENLHREVDTGSAVGGEAW